MLDTSIQITGKVLEIIENPDNELEQEILLEVETDIYDENGVQIGYIRLKLNEQFSTYIDDDVHVGDYIYLYGDLDFNSNEKGEGKPELIIMVNALTHRKVG